MTAAIALPVMRLQVVFPPGEGPGKPVEAAEIAPGKWVSNVPWEDVPRVGIMRMRQLQDGSCRPVVESWSRYTRITDDIGERLQLPISADTFRDLVVTDIVNGSQISPHAWLIDLVSLHKHLDRTRGSAGPSFWSAEKRADYSTRRGYSQARSAPEARLLVQLKTAWRIAKGLDADEKGDTQPQADDLFGQDQRAERLRQLYLDYGGKPEDLTTP